MADFLFRCGCLELVGVVGVGGLGTAPEGLWAIIVVVGLGGLLAMLACTPIVRRGQ